jgi:peptidoglycan/xylan/chitin deacetylase (PgdA/CDA1 family)
MDDRFTATANTPRSQERALLRRPDRYRSDAPHHRRRRATAAVGAILAVALLIAATGSGGGPPHPRRAASQPNAAVVPRGTISPQQQAENAAIDRTLAYTPVVYAAGAQNREIALTFDDGPGPYTQRLVSTLLQLKVPGTFFQVGTLQKYFHDSTSEIVANGFPIGDHTFAHAPMSHLSEKDQQSQVLRDASAIGDFGAPFPRMFRPPYGLFNPTTLKVLRANKMLMVMWTVDTEDYRQPGVDAIVHRVVAGAQPGAIVLMHDAGGPRLETIEALPQIVSRLRAQGYVFVTVPRLLLDNPAPANQQQPTGLAGTGG